MGTDVTLSTISENAEIRYTTDGSEPNKASTLYTEPIKVSEATTIRAITFDTEGNASAIVAFEYTVYDDSEGTKIHHLQG